MLVLRRLPDRLAVVRLPPDARLPEWVGPDDAGFLSVTRTADELSVVCAESRVPDGAVSERGWGAFSVRGPLDFGLTGVLASIATPLAEAGIPVFVISTYDTDHVLVRCADMDRAADRLRRAGHVLEG